MPVTARTSSSPRPGKRPVTKATKVSSSPTVRRHSSSRGPLSVPAKTEKRRARKARSPKSAGPLQLVRRLEGDPGAERVAAQDVGAVRLDAADRLDVGRRHLPDRGVGG